MPWSAQGCAPFPMSPADTCSVPKGADEHKRPGLFQKRRVLMHSRQPYRTRRQERHDGTLHNVALDDPLEPRGERRQRRCRPPHARSSLVRRARGWKASSPLMACRPMRCHVQGDGGFIVQGVPDSLKQIAKHA